MAALSFPTQATKLTVAADNILRNAAPAKLDWKPVDTDTLPHELATLYSTYKAAQAHASAARVAFEDAICGPLAKMLNARPGQDVAFGYKFGKLSVALTDKSAPRSATNALRF